MENSEQEKMKELVQKMTLANQKITQSYIDSLPNLLHSGKDLSEVLLSFTNKVSASPDSIGKVQNSYLDFMRNQMELWERTINRSKDNGYKPVITPAKGDKRFNAPEWEEYPYYFDVIKQSYLLVSHLISSIIEMVDLDEATKRKLRFYTQQYLDALSPSNFAFTNPEVQKHIKETKGQCLIDGMQNLLADIEKGRISQTDTTAFEVGKNLASTRGSVVFENEMMQLIQYDAAAAKVHEIPLMIIPPWINRFYILDLEPDNSFVRFALEKGFSTFMISWKVPTEKNGGGNFSFDDYASKGALKAIEVIQHITNAKKVNVFGYCIGGTLLGTVLAILAAKKKTHVNTATFLATMLDFSDIGALGAVVDEPLVKKLEGELKGGKVLSGKDMTNAFNMVRANDLIWPYIVNNYMKGKTPAPYSILYWTNDNTNLPGNMYAYYLRHFIINNELAKKNALSVCKTPIDLSKVKTPAFIVGLREDHISPCRTTFATTHLLKGETEFVLGEAGHVVGAVNPPSKNKYGYLINGKLGGSLDEWETKAQRCEGTWWKHWAGWLKKKSGKLVAAHSKNGNADYPEIEPAPGRYVKEKME